VLPDEPGMEVRSDEDMSAADAERGDIGPSTRSVTFRSVPDTTEAEAVKAVEGGRSMKRHVDCLGGRLVRRGEEGGRSKGRRSKWREVETCIGAGIFSGLGWLFVEGGREPFYGVRCCR